MVNLRNTSSISVVELSSDAPAQADYTRLRDLIRNDIIQGRLKAGAKLKIAELAQRYGLSAIPVREALQQLQGEGIVRFIANRGASVRPIDENFIRDIHEIRALIEPFLIRWFVRHHSEDELVALAQAQRDFDAAITAGDLSQNRQQNKVFHGICYDGHYNQEALTTAYRHNELIHALSDRFPRSRARAQAVSREHWAIVEAVRLQNEDEASRLVCEHVRNSGQHLIEMMQTASHRPQAIDREPGD